MWNYIILFQSSCLTHKETAAWNWRASPVQARERKYWDQCWEVFCDNLTLKWRRWHSLFFQHEVVLCPKIVSHEKPEYMMFCMKSDSRLRIESGCFNVTGTFKDGLYNAIKYFNTLLSMIFDLIWLSPSIRCIFIYNEHIPPLTCRETVQGSFAKLALPSKLTFYTVTQILHSLQQLLLLVNESLQGSVTCSRAIRLCLLTENRQCASRGM